jgi:GntR family transcriptional repressor for pyruvate dehydrogenase complex
MNFQKISHTSLYKDVLIQLEKYIENNNLKQGDSLPTERVMAEQLGISRGTLREAFRILEANGVIDVTPGGGRFLKRDVARSNLIIDMVNELDPVGIVDLMEIREILEIRIIELVIEKATDDELDEIENGLSRGNDLFEIDNTFHLALAKASHNTAFYSFMKFNLFLLAKIRMKSLGKLEREQKMPVEHKEVLEAIKLRNKDIAKEKIIEHLEAVKHSIIKEA